MISTTDKVAKLLQVCKDILHLIWQKFGRMFTGEVQYNTVFDCCRVNKMQNSPIQSAFVFSKQDFKMICCPCPHLV